MSSGAFSNAAFWCSQMVLLSSLYIFPKFTVLFLNISLSDRSMLSDTPLVALLRVNYLSVG